MQTKYTWYIRIKSPVPPYSQCPYFLKGSQASSHKLHPWELNTSDQHALLQQQKPVDLDLKPKGPMSRHERDIPNPPPQKKHGAPT